MKNNIKLFAFIFFLLFTLTGCSTQYDYEVTTNNDNVINDSEPSIESSKEFESSSTNSAVETSRLFQSEPTEITDSTTPTENNDKATNTPPPMLILRGYEKIKQFIIDADVMSDEEFMNTNTYYDYTKEEALAIIEELNKINLPTVNGDGSDIVDLTIYTDSNIMDITCKFDDGCSYRFYYDFPIDSETNKITLNTKQPDASQLITTYANFAQIDIVWRTDYGRYCGVVTYEGYPINFVANKIVSSEHVKEEIEQFEYIKFSDIF